MIQLRYHAKEFTMLQANEVARRFGAIEQAIGQAAQLCGKQQEMPMDLKDCINQMDQQKSAVRQAIDTHDDTRIRQAVDQMESLGDRAKRACGTASSLTPEMKSAVLKVHDELSDLKHQLH
jgi:phage shock protein A